MPHFSLKQRTQLPPICQLPDEIVEEIVSELDQHRDLVAFALASRICATLVIPHHTQYRILGMRGTLPYVWAHLARRVDLARNVREVHISEPSNHWALDHHPTTLIDPQLDRGLSNVEESVRIRNICLALSHMHRLHTFTWSWKDPQGNQRPTSHPAHENSILTTISRHPALEHLSLNGRFAMHALNSQIDSSSLMYPVWGLENLRSLSLAGDTWAKLGNSRHLSHLIARSPNLEYLEVPLEFQHLADCKLPKLKKLKLVLQSGGVDVGIDASRSRFLENHPSIEELDWSPVGIPQLSHDCLPNLKSLRSNIHLVISLNDPDVGPNPIGLMTPPSTPLTSIIPVPVEPYPAPMTIVRRVENLDVFYLDAQTLLEVKFLDRQALRRLKLHRFGDISTLHEIADSFPNIEWLSLPSMHMPSDSRDSVQVSWEEWLDILPRFSKLQVFHGLGLWTSVMNDRQAMHEMILNLVHTCPHLRTLDRINKFNKHDASSHIDIVREGAHVRYQVKKYSSRNSFDVMDGSFA